MKFIVVFYSQSGAIKFDRQMKKSNITCTLAPTPRKLSSSCGTCANIDFDGQISDIVTDEIESIHRVIEPHVYEAVYENED